LWPNGRPSQLLLSTSFFGSRTARTGQRILTIYRPTSYDVFPRKKVPFRGGGKTVAHLGVKFLPKPTILGCE